MRNLLASTAALVLLGGLSGCCHHTAGRCDCDTASTVSCCDPYGSLGIAVAGPGAAVVKPEVIKEMPKETPKQLPDK